MIKPTLTCILFSLWSFAMHAQAVELKHVTLKTIDGQEIHLDDYIGKKPVYFKFWASWCIPCRQQMPHLERIYQTYGKQIEVLAINLNVNDTLETVKATQREFGLTMPIIQDKGGLLAQTFDLRATPYHVLLNKQGQVIYTGHSDNADTGKLDTILAALARGTANAEKARHFDHAIQQTPATLPTFDKPTVLFFASAWCDWYLKDSRPAMAARCVQAQQQVNALAKAFPQLHWQGVLTRLWTGEKELTEYKKKYQIPFALMIDTDNALFFHYHVDSFPTLLAIAHGKEVFRTQSFSDPQVLTRQLQQLSAPR
jgi:thiol-disulfide isomerase/thioredoxin